MRTRNRDTVTTQPASLVSTIMTESPLTGTSLFHGVSYTETPTVRNRSLGIQGFGAKTGVIETMVDVVGSPSTYNEVTHDKIEWDAPLATKSYDGREAAAGYQPATASSIAQMSCGPDNLTQKIDQTPSYWDSESNAVARATNLLQTDIQTSGFNLPVFLGELRDFRDIAHSVNGRLKRSERARSSAGNDILSKYVRRRGNRSFLGVVRDLLSADLLVQFAIKPLISDVRQLFKFGAHMSSQAARLEASSPQRAVSSVVDRGSDNQSVNLSSVDHHWSTEYEYERLVTAWSLYKIKLTEELRPPAWLTALDALDVDRPIDAAWELLPYSFVVDYFIDIGGFLKNFKGGFINLPIETLQEGYSVKTVRQSVCTLELEQGANVNRYASESNVPTIVGSLKKTHYRRVADDLPHGQIAWPQVRVPNLRQVQNLAELLFLRGTRRG